jgi:DNA-binding SARP family transcriptional activator/tetratricopeptide (TPR) repeat protein
MEFRVLGPVQVFDDERVVPIPAGRVRTLLAVLLLRVDRVVTMPELVDSLWEESPPEHPRAAIQTYIARLRQAMGETGQRLIHTKPHGYLIELDAASLDLTRFRWLVEHAGDAAEPSERARLLGQALALWRDEPLADVAPGSRIRDEVPRLIEERLHAVELWMGTRLELGQHTEIVPELTALTREHPLRERLWALLMLAQYRCGRRADALETYRAAAARLADELGIDPGDELRRLQHAVLTADPQLPAPVPESPPTTVPRQLPAQPRVFAGRAHELARLTDVVDAHNHPASAVVISAIGGTGGIGKTWLALHWAHRNAGRFPDGQLYVDLRGFDPSGEPVPPAAALRGFLAALGVPPAALPVDVDARAALYRSLVAGKRMLVVLDNAKDSAQVTPLLPGSAPCVVLVTSRNQLASLVATHGAIPLCLDVLDEREARELLAGHLGLSRLAAEPGAVAVLLARCAGLPLALSIVAARAATNPDLGLSALAERIDDASTRLDALEAGDPVANLGAVFSWSYRALDAEAASVLGLLGLAPGPEIALPAVASLTAQTTEHARAVLGRLEAAHLVTQHVPGRYRMHDLVRIYAAEQAHHDQPRQARTAALRRLIDFYLHTANTGDRLLNPHRQAISLDEPAPGCRPLPLADEASALAWFDGEHGCLLAAQALAAQQGWHPAVWQLAWTTEVFHWWRGHLDDDVTAWQAGLDAARRLDDPAVQARAHRRLGQAHALTGNHGEALSHLRRALALTERTGDIPDQAHTHDTLASALEHQGDYRQALVHAVDALRLYQAIDNTTWQANALNTVGWYHARLGHHRSARDACERALALHREHGNRLGEANTLDSLGYIAHHTGRPSDAVECYHQAITLFREAGNAYEEADTLVNLGAAYAATGRHNCAREAWRRAIDLYHAQHRPSDAQRTKVRMAAIDADG